MNVVHLAKRYVGSLSKTPPSAEDEAWAMTWMSAADMSACASSFAR